jgi:hypothetical protein
MCPTCLGFIGPSLEAYMLKRRLFRRNSFLAVIFTEHLKAFYD